MPSTERLYAQLDEANNESADIRERGRKLHNAIAELIRAFAADHKCDPEYAIDGLDDLLSDLIDDAEGPSYRRAIRIEHEIGRIEEADLYRSSPVVI